MNQPNNNLRSLSTIYKPNEPAQPNEQQMLAQALRGSRGMPQQQLSEEEKMMIMQLMQQGMTQEQAMQELMRMKSVA